MNKKFATATLALALFVSPVTVHADAISDLQAQANALLAQLTALRAAGTVSPVLNDNESAGGASVQCPALTATLAIGLTDASTGGQVSQLQGFLTDHFNITEDIVTGYFGVKTARYVRQFQAQEGIDQVGFVGRLTRAAVARRCTVSPTTIPAITTVLIPAHAQNDTPVSPEISSLNAQIQQFLSQITASPDSPDLPQWQAQIKDLLARLAQLQPSPTILPQTNEGVISSFSASPATVTAGQPTTLSWSSSWDNCSVWDVTKQGDYKLINSVAGRASTQTLYPQISTTYQLQCRGAARGDRDVPIAESLINVTVIQGTLTASPASGTAPLTVHFRGVSPLLEPGAFIQYGDGTWDSALEGVVPRATVTDLGGTKEFNVTYQYVRAGTYTATLHRNGGKGEEVARTTVVVW